MPTEKAVRSVHPIAFGFIIFFALVEFFITAVLVSDYNRNNNYPTVSIRDRLRFLLFSSIWSLIFSSAYLFGTLLAPANFLFSIASHAGFIFVSWIFWLAGAASWTDALGGSLSCGDLFMRYKVIDISFTYCHSLKAVAAFAWLEWITLTLLLAYVALVGSKASKSGGAGLASPMREVQLQATAAGPAAV